MTLPLALSVPHAGLLVPPALADQCALSGDQIVADGDVGAAAIYDLASQVRAFVTTSVARAVLDMNRAVDDRRADGVVKTHTCWNEPVWREPLSAQQIERLLTEHHHPYHATLASFAGRVKLAVDCHTMATVGPPIGPDTGVRRPLVCLGDGGGTACPGHWFEALHACFVRHFGADVTMNEPFAGGYITRTHGGGQPWVQIEISRTEAMTLSDKRDGVLRALQDWCQLEL